MADGKGEPNATEVELAVLRRAVEDARSEARMAIVAARAAESALARQRERTQQALARERAQASEARRLAKKWKKDYKFAKKKYDRLTVGMPWKLFASCSRALAIARRLLTLSNGPASWVGMLSGRTAPKGVKEEGQHVLRGQLTPTSIEDMSSAERLKTVALPKVRESKWLVKGKPKSKARPANTELPTRSPAEHGLPDLDSLNTERPGARIAVVLHLYYPELWPDFRDALRSIPEPADLFVTLTAGRSDGAADWIRADFPGAQIITLDNLGRDIFPFVTLVNSGVLFGYTFVCKLHTKRSLHNEEGDAWRNDLLRGVLADSDYVARVLAAFGTDPGLGIVVDDGSVRNESKNWQSHVKQVNELCGRIGLPEVKAEAGWPEFPAGSIYWARSSLLEPLARLGLTAADFEPEPLPTDGCTPHAIERLVGHLCREAGMYVATSSTFSERNSRDRSLPHFVRDYRRLVKELQLTHGCKRAMELGVGGEFAAGGTLECSLLQHLGLREGQFIVDVGCGSGRLAAALARGPKVDYHGTDVVEEFLQYARGHSPEHFRYSLVGGLFIPERTDAADFVTFFSVMTHLQLHESYAYLREAARVAKPGGRIVISFLETTNPNHWPIFLDTVEAASRQALPHLNNFIEAPVVETWASSLSLLVEGIFHAGTPFIPLPQPLVFESGKRAEEKADFAQSIAVLRKPD